MILLKLLFDEIFIPNAVANEILAAKGKRRFAVYELNRAVYKEHIKIYTVKDKQLVNKLFGKLHKGELEVIVGAKELNTDFAIIDEIAARNLSKIMSIETIGTIGILKLGKRKGHILFLKPLLLELRRNKFRISDKLMKKILTDANEK